MSSGLVDDLAAWERERNAGRDSIGPSSVGGCENALVHALRSGGRGDPGEPDAVPLSGIAWHALIADVRGGRDGIRSEVPVEIVVPETTPPFLLRGTADEVEATTCRDWKTTTLATREKVAEEGPSYQHWIQVSLYAAALNAAGTPIDTVSLVYLPVRDGSLDAYEWAAPYDPAAAEEGFRRIRSALTLAAVGVDGARERPWFYCERYCPYFRPCRGGGGPTEDLDDASEALAEEYAELSHRITTATARRDEIRPYLIGLNAAGARYAVRTSGADGYAESVEPDTETLAAWWRLISDEPVPAVVRRRRTSARLYVRPTRETTTAP